MPRDLDYEHTNTGYDWQHPREEGGGIMCKNYALCGELLPTWWYDCKSHYRCVNCDIQFGCDLEFRRDCTEECAVCLENDHVQVQFPSECKHPICVGCARKLLFFDETQYYFCKEMFNCPPCPNGCKNVSRGPQCSCEEYELVVDAWAELNPEDYEEYDTIQTAFIDSKRSEFEAKQKCPLCRKRLSTPLWRQKLDEQREQ